MRASALFLFLFLVVGCNDSHGRTDGGGADAGLRDDAGVVRDAGADDGGGADAGSCVREPAEHRVAAMMCDNERPYPDIDPEAAEMSTCTQHDDCTDGLNGRCVGSSFHGYRCTYDRCFADDECSDGPCACGGPWSDSNRCLQGDCQVDSDCGPGGYCSPSLGTCGDYGGVVGYFCHSCEDECADDSDCPDDPMGGLEQRGYCAYDAEVGHWACSHLACAG